MKTGWEETILGNVCAIVSGSGFPKKHQGIQKAQHPFFKVGDMNSAGNEKVLAIANNYVSEELRGQLGAKLIPIGSVVFPKVGGAIRTNKKRQLIHPSCVDNNVMGLVPDEAYLLPEYLSWWMQSIDIYEFSNKAALPSITKKAVSSWPFVLPPLEEQKRIVAVLDAAFEGLDRARAHTEANLQNARDLFESGLDAEFNFNGENWQLQNFGNIEFLEIHDGDRGVNYPKKKDFFSEGHCLFLNTKNVRPDGFNFEKCQFIDSKRDNLLRKGKLKPRDVLLTTRGTIGNIAVFDESVPYDHIRINSGMIILRPNEKKILAEYLFEVLRSGFVKSQIKEKTSGAAQPQLPIKTLVTLKFPVPKSTEEQSILIQKMKSLSDETNVLIQHYQSKLTDLDDLRQSLLQKAFAGELT